MPGPSTGQRPFSQPQKVMSSAYTPGFGSLIGSRLAQPELEGDVPVGFLLERDAQVLDGHTGARDVLDLTR